MAGVVAEQKYTTENSTHLTRPGLSLFLQPDTNQGETNITSFKEKQAQLKLHVPSATGTPSYPTDCCDNKLEKKSKGDVLKKVNTLRVVDPITSFISASGEVLLCTNKYGLPTFGNSRKEPQTQVPQNTHSIRTQNEAINELKRTSELKWNSQKVLDTVLKSRLGGWTSAVDAKTKENAVKSLRAFKLTDIFPHMQLPKYANDDERDQLAKNYIYTTSTQEAYSHVNWDAKLPSKLHAPTSTYEKFVDPLKESDQIDHRTQIWQTSIGSTWDRQQERKFFFSKEPVRFVAPLTRAKQIPGYSGHVSGKNTHYMDDVIETFEPFTVLRTTQPKLTDPNYKPNIPGYTGHTHNFKTSSVSHYDNDGVPYTTTAAFHRQMPNYITNNTKLPQPSLYGDFSKIETTVPPSNPYDNISRPIPTTSNQNLPSDSQNFPIIINKNTNDAQFMTKNRETELRSILKNTDSQNLKK